MGVGFLAVQHFHRYSEENTKLLCHKCFVADVNNATDLSDQELGGQKTSLASPDRHALGACASSGGRARGVAAPSE